MKTKRKAIRRVQSISELPCLDPYLDVQQTGGTFEVLKRKQPPCENTASDICGTSVSKKICQRQNAQNQQNSLPESQPSPCTPFGHPKSPADTASVSTHAARSPVVFSQCEFFFPYLRVIYYAIILSFTYQSC